MKFSRLFVATVFAGLLLGACTSTTITPMEVKASPQNNSPGSNSPKSYSAIVVGAITAKDSLWNTNAEYVRRALVKKLTDGKNFAQVMDQAPTPLPDNTALLSGEITDVDAGDKALRALIGFGAGEATMTGVFKIQNASGAVLASFQTEKGYSGGAGIGGFDLVDMNDLAGKLGEETADVVVRWSKGQKLKP